MHRNHEFWPDPLRFDPGRYEQPGLPGGHRYAYLPFGAGPRFCIGSNLGLMEASIVLAVVTRDLSLRRVPGYTVAAEPMLRLRVHGGLPMTVHSA
jgi:cytochrome P450